MDHNVYHDRRNRGLTSSVHDAISISVNVALRFFLGKGSPSSCVGYMVCGSPGLLHMKVWVESQADFERFC